MTGFLRVLTVEDNPDDAELLLLELEQQGYQVLAERVETAPQMSAALDRQPWDVVLADYSMPFFDAVAALTLMQEKGLDLPFIIVSGSIEEEVAVAAMRTGAHDYLLKDNLARLGPVLERELREAQVRRERKQALEEIKRLAFYDELTGLPNRTLFLQELQDHIDSVQPNLALFGVVFLDIDRYQSIKYGFGHDKGNQFLIEVAQRLEVWRRSADRLARVGEDAFALLLKDLSNLDEIEQQVTQIHQILGQPFQVDQSFIYSSASIGVVDSTVAYDQAEEFLRAADTATYNAKRQADRTVFFNAQMQTEELERLQLEADLQQAIQRQQLQLHYQPIVSLTDQKVIGFEALARWYHPVRGWISPGEFIPLAEQTGLIIPLGEWVLVEACQQLSQWQQVLEQALPLSVTVNVSGIQLTQSNLISTLEKLCCPFNSSDVHLKVEITESVLMANAETTIGILQQLSAKQIQICVDDFGTGYSSLSYLHRFPINTLKIDRSFINRITEDRKYFDIVKTIIALAHTLGLNVVAEGIETQDQVDQLRSLSCEYGQGYYFARPLAASSLTDWMQSRTVLR